MNSGKLKYCLLRAVMTAILVLIIEWASGGRFTLAQEATFALLVYLVLFIQNVGDEMAKRLKAIGGYVDEDEEFDEHQDGI